MNYVLTQDRVLGIQEVHPAEARSLRTRRLFADGGDYGDGDPGT